MSFLKKLGWLPVILCVACLTYGYGITNLGLWGDEGYSFLFGYGSLGTLFNAMRTYYFEPPLWSLLCKGLISVIGSHAWVVRIPSLLAGLASIALIYQFFASLKRKRAGLYAAALLSVSPLAVLYAQDGRAYASFAFLYLAAICASQAYLDRSSKRALIWGGVANLALLYLHNYAPVFVATIALYGFFVCMRERRKDLLKYWLIAQGVVICLYLPFAIYFRAQNDMLADNRFLPRAWEGLNGFTAILHSLQNLIPGRWSSRSLFPVPHLEDFSFLAILMVLGVLAAGFVKPARRTFLTCIFFILAPLTAIALYSTWIHPAYVVGRTEVTVAALFCALLGETIDRLPSRWIRSACLLFFLTCGALSLLNYHFSEAFPRKQWDKRTFERIVSREPQDLVILYSNVRASVPTYFLTQQRPETVRLFPEDQLAEFERWPERFLFLQQLKTSSTATLETSQELFRDYLNSHPVSRLAVVFSSPGQERGIWVVPDRMRPFLDFLLREMRYHKRDNLAVYPMDWQPGYHVILFLERPAQ